MDPLPVELVRLIFQFCDGPSVRTLRLGARRYALIGYEYLIPAHFMAVGWRDDVQRLHNIACHERLRNAVQTLTFNFSKLRENLSRVEYHTLSQNRLLLLDDFMDNVAWREHLSRDMAPFHTRRDTLEDALTRLSSLNALEITFTRSPHHVDGLSDVFELFQCRTQDDITAVENITTVISALRRTHLQTLTIDQLPLRTFSSPMGRRPWFESPAVFANLSRLDLVVYVPNDLGPNKLSRGICSLGDVLQLSTNLTDLRLGFRKQTHRGDEKFHVQFDALFRNNLTFNKLTDLKLECMSCTEWDLKRFLLRHASTLERLRLGGRGLALSREGHGGIHLSEGRWKSLFASLRGNLPKLQRLHLEGDFESGRFVASKEKWTFKPSTDDDWNELGDGDNLFRDYLRQGVRYNHDSQELERFVIAGGPWPAFQPAYTPGAVNFSSQSAGLASALATLLDQDNLGYQVAPMSSATTQNSGSTHHSSPLAPLSSSILSHRPHPSSTALGGQS